MEKQMFYEKQKGTEQQKPALGTNHELHVTFVNIHVTQS